MILPLRRLNPAVPLPAYATPGSAGLDLCASIAEPITLMPGEHRHIPTGIAVAIPEGYEGQVRARSGLAAKHGIGMVNGVGTIDSDYRGEVGFLLVNHGVQPFRVEPGMRCAQLVIAPVVRVQLSERRELPGTVRGEGGFGSTGVSSARVPTAEELMRGGR